MTTTLPTASASPLWSRPHRKLPRPPIHGPGEWAGSGEGELSADIRRGTAKPDYLVIELATEGSPAELTTRPGTSRKAAAGGE